MKVRRSLPATLGRFRVVERLGAGHSHVVYRASEPATELSFAIKVPAMHFAPEQLAQARREREILRAIDDARLARLHEVSDEPPLAVFELVTGTPTVGLAPMPWRRALAIVAQLCPLLQLVARRGLIARRLTPEHVFVRPAAPSAPGGDPYRGFVEPSDEVKLILDSNLGTSTPPVHTGFGGYIGPIDFMAPELLEGQQGDERSYTFALGAIAYFLIVGRCPFGELSLVARFVPPAFPVTAPSALVPEVPRAVDEVLLPCLRAAAAKRPMLGSLHEQLRGLIG